MRYQDPKLERHGQSWRIRPFIVRIDPATGKAALAKGDGWLFARTDNGDLPDDRDLQQHVWRPAAEAAGCYAARVRVP